MTGHSYERTGILAVDPTAFGFLFAEPPSRDTIDMDGVPVLTIRGPLEHHAGMWCDSYDAILARASDALSSPAPGIVLRIDSPGGLVSGCMETARAIRALADGAGKKIVAYADGQVCSAAYAIACVAHTIVAPESATIGSIGVLAARADVSAALAAEGKRVHLVRSGTRKGHGDPHVPVAEDEFAALRESVDTLSDLFFAHVARYRPITAEDARELQAATVHGQRAVDLRLADQLGGINDAVALLRPAQSAAPAATEDAMASNLEEGLAKLRKAAEGDDEEAKKARRMLAAMDEDEGDGDGDKDAETEEDDKEGKAKSASAPAAESEDPPPPSKKDDEEDAKAIAARALATAEATARRTLLAGRPDLSDKMRAALSDPAMPLAQAEAILAATPRTPRAKAPPEPAAPTQGSHETNVTSLAAVNARLGLSEQPGGIVREGNKIKYHAMTPSEARAELERRAGGDR